MVIFHCYVSSPLDQQPIRPVAVVAPVPPVRSQRLRRSPLRPPPAERGPAERQVERAAVPPPVESLCGEFSRNMRND